MLAVEFERKITVGNLLSAAVMFGGIMLAWGNLDSRTKENTDDITQLSAQITGMSTKVESLDDKIDARLGALTDSVNADRLGLARTLTQLQTDLSYVKSALDAESRRTQ